MAASQGTVFSQVAKHLPHKKAIVGGQSFKKLVQDLRVTGGDDRSVALLTAQGPSLGSLERLQV